MSQHTSEHNKELAPKVALLHRRHAKGHGKRANALLIAVLVFLGFAAWHFNADSLQRWYYSRQTTQVLLKNAQANPTNLVLLELTGERLLEEGRPDDCAALMTTALQTYPNSSKLNLLAGRAAMARAEWKRAAALLNAALQAAPQSPDVLFWSAELLYQRGRKQMAEQILRDVTRLAPERADAWRRLGEIALTAQDYVGALKNFEEAKRRDPSAQIALLRAQTLHKLGKLKDAEAAVNESLKLEPSATGYALLGEIIQATPGADSLKKARGYLQKAVDSDPGNVDTLKLLALNYRAGGEHRQAVNVLRHLIQLDPATSENYFLLSQSYAALKRASLSKATLAIFNALAPLQQKADAAQHRVVIERGSLSSQLAQARLLLKMGREDMARIVLNRAKAKAPDHPEITRLLTLAQGPMSLKIPPLPPDAEAEAL